MVTSGEISQKHAPRASAEHARSDAAFG
jgi:hypothetical protein